MASDAPASASSVTPVSPVFMALLVGMTALAPLSMQIFVPALPAIQRGFEVPTGVAQLALSLSILANAFATLSYGPLSDRFGRRPAVLVGLGLFVAGSVMCALAPTIGLLILGRIVQAAGAAAGMVIARAIVRDLYDRDRAASMIAYLTMAMVVAPMLAPSVGAILMDLADWRAIFVALTVAGIMLLWSARLRLTETRRHGGGGSLLTGGGSLLRSPAFLSYVLQSAFSMSTFFAFVSGAPYFMIDVLDRPATEYGLWFIIVSVGYMAGNFTAARVTGRVGLDRMILIGSVFALIGTSLPFGLLLALPWAPALLFGPVVLSALSNGFAMPNAQAGAISVDPALAGTASGVAGFTQLFFAALVSQAVGMLQDGTPYPMLLFMIGLRHALAARLRAAAPAGRAARLVREKVRVESLLQRPGRSNRQCVRRKTGLDQRLTTAVPIALLEALASVRAQTRAGFQIITQPAAVLEDRGQPAPRASAGLVPVLQEVLENHHEVTSDRSSLARSQALHLVDQIGDVELLEPALAEQPRLLLDPEAEIAVVERRLRSNSYLCGRHGHGPLLASCRCACAGCPRATPSRQRRRAGGG